MSLTQVINNVVEAIGADIKDLFTRVTALEVAEVASEEFMVNRARTSVRTQMMIAKQILENQS